MRWGWGVVVCNDPLIIDLWFSAYSGWGSARQLQVWPCFLLLWSLLTLFLSFSSLLMPRCHLIIPQWTHCFCVCIISLLKYAWAFLWIWSCMFSLCFFLFSGYPTMRFSGTPTTSSLSSTSSSWCTWSGRSRGWWQHYIYVCVGLSLLEFPYVCQQISEPPSNSWRRLGLSVTSTSQTKS